jgi:3-deoxy-D-manno-octulosonate 8-phosphate phosphatase (KDO 8-P phosphatase)
MSIQQQIDPIRLLVCDVDGVVTDGMIIYGSDNMEIKNFNVKDGLAIKLAAWCNLPVVWLTGRSSDAVAHRAAELNVQVFQGSKDKEAGLRNIATELGLELEQIAYLADDINDLPALVLAGLPMAVADAAPEVLAKAAYVTKLPGGHGAVREAIELILRGQGCWDQSVESYLNHLRVAKPAHWTPH